MKIARWTVICVALSMMELAVAHADPLAEHVVVISVDGLPAYLRNDTNVPLQNIRGLAARGVAAEGMTVSNPSVTWPNHTSMVSGAGPAEHGVLFNGVLEHPGLGLPVQVNPKTDKSQLVHVPTIMDAVAAAGGTVAAINWPCTRNSASLLVNFPDTPETMKYTTPEFIDSMIQAKLVPEDIRDSFGRNSPIARDRIWTLATCHAIEKYKPTLTYLHLLNVDAVHHRYGPSTWAGYSAVAFADTCIGEVLKAIDAAGIRDQTTVIIVSDHGFISIPKMIRPNVVFRQAGLLTVEGSKIATARVHAYPEGGTAMVYVTVPDSAKRDTQEAIDALQKVEGIADIIMPDRFAEFGYPLPEEYPQMASFVLSAKDGYGFDGTATGDQVVVTSEGTLGTHGFLSTNPKMNATFVAAGAGIKAGEQLGTIKNIQVAPTIARLLDVKFHPTTGQPLAEILEAARK